MRRLSTPLLLLFAAAAVRAAEPVANVSVVDPRAFGHFIGDRLVRELSFDVTQPWALTPADGTQKLGRTDAWVELIDSRSRVSQVPGGKRYHLTLTYQIINSPPQLELITVPGIDAAITGAGEIRSVHLPDWLLLLSPLTGADVRIGLDAERPARAPRLIETRHALWRAVVAGVLGLMFTVWFVVERWGFLAFRSLGGPFAQARRTLKRLGREPASHEREREAFKVLHRAFDATAGHRLFGERVDAFLAAHPEFSDSKPQIQRFYSASRSEFFGAGNDAMPLRELLQLSEHLQRRERASGRGHVAAV